MAEFNSLPPEIQAALIQELMQTDPLARSVNDYGQGSAFLGLDEQPESWDRLGEKNDLYTDMFKTTQTYLRDFIPDLHPEVEDPGIFQGYKSDKADLYRNNPAYDQIDQYVRDGASFEEALQLVIEDPELAPNLPKNEYDEVDRIALRNSAETYVSERAREGREFDAYDAEQQAYEDYVRPRTGMDFAPARVDDVSTLLKPDVQGPGPIADRFGRAAILDRVGLNPMQARPQDQGSAETVSSLLGKARSNMDNPLYDGRDVDRREAKTTTARKAPTRNAYRSQGGRGMMTPDPKKERQAQQGNVDLYNKMLQQAYSRTVANKERRSAPSKKQENNAKLVRAYNMLMYGE